VRDKERSGQLKKFLDFEQEFLDENPTQTFFELSKASNITPFQNACMPWKRFIRKKYDYHMSCQKMPF